MANEIVKYTTGGQEITLDYQTVKNFLLAGNGNITDQELKLFIELNKNRGLNPWLRESYLIKYGNSPATIIVGKDAILKKAMSNPTYGGHEAGITIVNREGKIERRAGSMLLPREELVGGWCKVIKHTVSGNAEINHEVGFDEYAMRDDQGKLKSNWKVKPATMIRKVALCQALREAFPEDTAGMFEAEEMGIDEKQLPTQPVDNYKVVADVTPQNDVQDVPQDFKDITPPNPLQDALRLSDSDFLSYNFTFNGKTKMVGQIKYDAWEKLAKHPDFDIVKIAERALKLLAPMKPISPEDEVPLPWAE